VNAAGAAQSGNATGATHAGPGVYTVDFGRDVTGCVAGATLAAVKNGTGTDAPDPGLATVAPGATATTLTVSTFKVPGGTPADEPFDLIVAC
jgi:hypothetical protein